MIDLTGCVSIPYFRKASFTGSCGTMRYLIKKEEKDTGEVLCACWWRGPYASHKVPEEEKTSAFFPFTEEGIRQAVDWLNQVP